MAAFPNLPFDAETAEELLDDIKLDRATNGSARGRALYAAPKLRLTAAFRALTAAQRAAVDAHYSAHRSASFALLWRGQTYTVAYTTAPKWGRIGGVLWNLNTTFEEV
jgi:hypothetical protein